MNYDDINKPKHYNQGTIEPSDYIADHKLNFFEGNIVKYVTRHMHKGGRKDLEKARWYLNYLIENYEKFEGKIEVTIQGPSEADMKASREAIGKMFKDFAGGCK